MISHDYERSQAESCLRLCMLKTVLWGQILIADDPQSGTSNWPVYESVWKHLQACVSTIPHFTNTAKLSLLCFSTALGRIHSLYIVPVLSRLALLYFILKCIGFKVRSRRTLFYQSTQDSLLYTRVGPHVIYTQYN